MHENSMKLMQYFKNKHTWQNCSVLDIGACQVKGQKDTYRSLFDDCQYTGMDIVSGPNVDIVGWKSIYFRYDFVICGQVLEHVEYPWEFLTNLKKYFKHMICIIVPNTLHEHRYPIDCYRFFPDGMRALFKYAHIKEIEILKRGKDTFAVGAHHD
jgi:hypothetical protein